MNDQELGVLCKYVAGNWPSTAMNAETLEVFVLELSPFPFNDALATLRESFANAPFPPTPMQLRDAVLRRTQGAITYEQAMAELLDNVAAVGYASPEPEWSDPIIGEMVRLRGGWVEVCKATPARAAVDASGISAFNTWSAQFRDHFRNVAARGRTAPHAALGATLLEELPRPGSRFDEVEA